ncbi:hypothetical protein MSAN_00296700 [Mycena sanguinolenta]|uniref:F-box domain-containing protein n=1 Tax=Mycena sanguinolenta TaxID=230812 RepID=A0A8H6ZD92_9AGAR|nr:hypothetical protein MSAN_00296700 [Mycena sanguinolenta]
MSMGSALHENRADESPLMPGSLTQNPPSYLHILATELWLACWTLCSRRQLRRLSLVCKRFRDICLPLLFQQQTIEAGGWWYHLNRYNWVEPLRKLHRAALRLDALADSPHVGSVHSWKFAVVDSLPSEHEATNARLLKVFSATLSLYHNLRSLHLEGLVIDAPFRQTFSELSRLENLALHTCNIVTRNGFVMSLRSFARVRAIFVTSLLRLASPSVAEVREFDRIP